MQASARADERHGPRCQAGSSSHSTGPRTVTVWLAGCLLLTNHQRPGAIANMTLEDYNRAATATEGRDAYTTICVSKHKTGTTGRAKVTVGGPLSKLLAQYVQHLRPMHAESMLLFPNQTGRPLNHLSRRVQKLGAQYKLTLPTATKGRHAAATVASLHCTEWKQAAGATLMSHSHQTQQKYYANVKSRQESIQGFKIMRNYTRTVRARSRAGGVLPSRMRR